MAKKLLFGNENAEHDDLLYDCKIHHPSFEPDNHLVITGRWGTGKTAQLLILNESLTRELEKTNEDLGLIWYVQEDDLNFPELFVAFSGSSDNREFRKWLEKIWIAEILRRTVVILGNLDDYYGNINTPHWKLIRTIFNKQDISKTLWKQLPRVIQILTYKEKAEASAEIQDDISRVFQDELFKTVQKCLKDIDDKEIKPIIAIEPLETPNSDLDKQVSLAQEVIYSLVNVFERKFQPSQRQKLKVVLAIPWHRYKLKGINLPQKVSQYKYYMHWDADSLKGFINERISYEFKRVGRVKFDKKNAWYELFDKTISRSEHFETTIIEDTFDYALRFTHHRPRDLQKLVRLAVGLSSNITGRDKDEILKGVAGYKINENHLRKAVHSYRSDACNLLIEEYERGNPGFSDKVDKLSGFPACIEYTEFLSKLSHVGLDCRTDILPLWYSGIIGLEIFCEKNQQKFYAILPDEAKKTDRDINGISITRGYFFEYNTDLHINELITKYKNGNNENKINIVFHPKTFDTIIGQQARRWPIGI